LYEIRHPTSATKLAVCCQLQPDPFLSRDDPGDFAVFQLPKCCTVECPRRESASGVVERLGSEKTADMVGAEWNSVNIFHVVHLVSHGNPECISEDMTIRLDFVSWGQITVPWHFAAKGLTSMVMVDWSVMSRFALSGDTSHASA
jgi:hypothetical protein